MVISKSLAAQETPLHRAALVSGKKPLRGWILSIRNPG
jgi:hypothetical protein